MSSSSSGLTDNCSSVWFTADVTVWSYSRAWSDGSILKRMFLDKRREEGSGSYLSAPGTGSPTIVIKSLGRIPAWRGSVYGIIWKRWENVGITATRTRNLYRDVAERRGKKSTTACQDIMFTVFIRQTKHTVTALTQHRVQRRAFM